MVAISVRAATPDDAPFLALAMQEADRGHTGIGSWDVMFPGDDAPRLAMLATLATTSTPSYVHWSAFLVAEVGGEPAGTVSGYVPEQEPPARFAAACREALGDRADTALARSGAWSREFFTIAIPGDSTLIGQLLDDARAAGRSTAHVGTYSDNDPALATYRRLGFEDFAEARHADYERAFKTPGLVFLRRPL